MPNPNSPAGDDDTTLNQSTDQEGAGKAGLPDANDDAAGTSDAASGEDAKPSELDLEAVVRKAAGETSEEAEATSAEGKGNEGERPADAGKTDSAPEETPEQKAAKQAEADAKLPFHKHPRWQEVQKERDTLKAQVGELSTKAEQFDRIGGFMRENELTPEEVQQGFEIMALMKHDPAAALEKLAPHLDILSLASGRKLPPDLQAKVDAGEATPEIAQETARARADAAAARVRAERMGQEVHQDRVQQTATAMRSAVETWENTVKGTDPDYPHMQSFITDRTRVLMQANPPRTPDEAVALVKQAYSDVKAQMRRVLPAKTQVRTVTSDRSSTHATAAPTTLEGVIQAALRQ